MKQSFYLIGFLYIFLLPSFSQSKDIIIDKSWYHDEAHKYTISSAEQLMGLSDLVAGGVNFVGKTIYVRNDINVSSYVWQPIGTFSNPFSGVFDGNGYNISIGKMQAGELGGIFGSVVAGTVRNLSVSIIAEQQSIKTIGSIAALVDSLSVITFCTHTSSLYSKDAVTLGGIVGILDGKINACHNLGELHNENIGQNAVGGIAGISAGVITNSHNEALVSGTNVCGGIIGKNKDTDYYIKIYNCYNAGRISSRSTGEKQSNTIAGGIGGIVSNADIVECYNIAKINSYCYKSSDISTLSYSYAGGMIGIGYGNILTSYNTGDVVARCLTDVPDAVDGLAYVYSGGLIGYSSGNIVSTLSYCYNSGYIYAFGQGKNGAYLNYGGIIGDFSSFMARMKCCYSILGFSSAEGGYKGRLVSSNKNMGMQISAEQFKSPSFLYSSRDITSLNDNASYLSDEGYINDGFPVLLNVQTVGMDRTEGGGILLKGATQISYCQRGFYYWIAGLEEYVAEITATSDFDYKLENPESDQDYFFQAFIKMQDGTILKGEVMEFHLVE